MQHLKRITLLVIFILTSTNSWALETSPSDTLQVINKVINDLCDIRKLQHINTLIESTQIDQSKTPTDVYIKTYQLLEKLEMLSKKMGYARGEIVVLSPRKDGRRIPKDVLELLVQVDKITSTIRKHLGASSESMPVHYEPARTPSYVYLRVSKASLLVDTLLCKKY